MLLAAMREALIASLRDSRGLVIRRLRVGLALAVIALVVAIPVATVTHNVSVAIWVIVPPVWSLSFLYYADVMRLAFVPDFKLNVVAILRLTGIGGIFWGILGLIAGSVAVAIWRIPTTPHVHNLILQAVTYVVMTYLAVKFAFAPFALKDRGVIDACGRSWTLTTGRTFLPTLLFEAVIYSVIIATGEATKAAYALLAPWSWAVLRVVWDFGFAISVVPCVYIFLARWMVECEAVAVRSPITPPYQSERS